MENDFHNVVGDVDGVIGGVDSGSIGDVAQLWRKDARKSNANEICEDKVHWWRGEDLEKQRGIMQMRLSNTCYIGKHRLLFLIKDTPVKIVASNE